MSDTTQAQSDVAAIVLAAGLGTRFGGQKLLAHLRDGETDQRVIDATLQNICQSVARIVVVARDDPALLDRLAGFRVEVVTNVDPAAGMGVSLALGASRLLQTPPAAGVMVALADMPFVRPTSMQRLALALAARTSNNSVVVPVYSGQRGHPVGFSSAYLSRLAALGGQAGAKQLIDDARARGELVEIPLDDSGIVRDVDYVSDLYV